MISKFSFHTEVLGSVVYYTITVLIPDALVKIVPNHPCTTGVKSMTQLEL